MCSVFASILLSVDVNVLTLTQRVEAGLPTFDFPHFSLHLYDPIENVTIEKNMEAVLRVSSLNVNQCFFLEFVRETLHKI